MLVKPETLGMSSAQLARVAQHLQNEYVGPGKIAGALALVSRHHEVAELTCLGHMDLERGKPMREDTLFRVYSMTKPIASVALMQLVEQARIELSAPVSRYIPGWGELRVFDSGHHPDFVTRPASREMTVHDLMTHTSGLTYDFHERSSVDAAYRKLGVRTHQPGLTLKDLVGRLGTLPLEFSPGSAWNYSLSTDVVGYLVEQVSGQRLDHYLEQHILHPLGMHDTHFQVPEAKRERFAACYTRGRDKRLVLQDDPGSSFYTGEVTLLSAGGGLVSTLHDYHRFCRMLLAGGSLDGARILGRKTLESMTTNHLPGGKDLASLSTGSFSETPYRGVGFGLGFSVSLNPALGGNLGTPGEFAWGGMASTLFWVDPVESLIVIFMTQLIPSRTFNFRGQLKSLVYPALNG
jgi:CubicO group peptidase (beta-lactamase class C family)